MNSQEKNSDLRKPSNSGSENMTNSQGLSKSLFQNESNLLREDNKNRERLSSGMLSAHSGSLSNIVSEGDRGVKLDPMDFRDFALRRESYEDEGIRMRKASMPFIKTVMAEAKVVDIHDFSIFEWIEFQEILKSNYFVIKNESQSKEKVVEELDKLIVEYNKLFLKIRENNDRIRKKLEKEIISEEEVIKALMDKDEVFGDAAIFAKKLLFLIHEKPRVLATLVKNYQDPSSLKALEETLCSTFYEDIISDEAYDDDLIRLLAELLELEFEKATKVADVFYTEHFTNKMLTSYLKRNECKMYVKSILKNPLLSCIRETAKIRFDLVDIQKQLARRRKKTDDVNKTPDKSETRSRLNTGTNAKDMVEKLKKSTISTSPMKSESTEEVEEITVPRFQDKKQRSGLTIQTKISSEEFKAEEKPFEMIFHTPESPMRKIQDRDVVTMLERNFRLLKKHLSLLIQSIFDSIHSMPIGVRILCKIIYMLAKKKFPNLSDREYNEILGNFLFRKWISPNFISPEHNGILNDFQTNEEAVYNLTEIAKVLQNVFNQHLFSADDVKSELNDYILELRPSVNDYYQEVIAVNEEVVNQIRRGKRQSVNKIKSISICISLYEIQLLCEGIAKQKEKMLSLSPEAVNLAEKVLFYDRETKLFGEKVDPVTKHKIKPTQCFILFHELIFPSHLISDYLGEFNRIQGFARDQSEEQKIVCKVKQLMKNFLLSIEDIKNLVRLAKDGKMAMDDIFLKYSDKIYSFESKHVPTKGKTPLHIASRFLISTLKELEISYSRNNYYQLYQEMFTDFQKMANNLDFSISTTKLQLLKAYDALKRNFSALDEVNEKKKKAIKKSLIRDFIKSAKIPLCITSPSTTRMLGNATKGSSNKKTSIPEKIEVTVRDEKGCIHERFAIIRELAASNGGMLSGMTGRTKSESVGADRKSVGAGPNKDDIFNESNYHSKTIDEFIYIFGYLQEVKEAMVTGEDLFGVNEAITFFYHKVDAEPKPGLVHVAEDEYGLVMDEIENYICKRLYTKIFPREKTDQDKALWRRCKVLEWVNFTHLEIVLRNRSKDMWEYAANVLNEMDNRASPLEKLECMIECFRTITQVLELAASKEGAGSTDDTLPIMIYVIIKACPKRLHSNLNFISLLRDSERMLAGEGFCFTQVKSAVYAIETSDHDFFRVPEEEYKALIRAKETEYAILIKKEFEIDFE